MSGREQLKEIQQKLSPATFRRWKRAAFFKKDIPCNSRTRWLAEEFMRAYAKAHEEERKEIEGSDSEADEEKRASWSEERVAKYRKYLTKQRHNSYVDKKNNRYHEKQENSRIFINAIRKRRKSVGSMLKLMK